ncbi:MAG: pilus (MSHA type) biogenesis protein MshL [Nitrospirae bacterium]|nr:MAG: pilus (MSHA type) biogenesis protein MshL [Nitrospirota bacterium]
MLYRRLRGLTVLFLLLSLLSQGCASSVKKDKPIPEAQAEVKNTPPIPSPKPEPIPIPPPPVPEPEPVNVELSPLNERIISISVKNAALSDVLHSIAETVNLNLVMERGVNPDTPVTMTLKDIRAGDALDIVLSSTDYFYRIDGNVLYVSAYRTKTFEFGFPPLVQDYTVDLGGDILGSSSDQTSGKLKGNISLGAKADQKGFKLWDAIEESLKKILEKESEEDLTTFSINRMAGTLTVRATKKKLEEVRKYINRLKSILNRQVMIEARVVEVKLSKSLKYGIDWSFLDDWKGVGEFSIGTENFTDVIGTGEPFFQFGITGANFTSLLEALQSQGDVKVLSNPRVSLLNGQTALLSVGRSIEIISRVETTSNTATSSSSTTTFTVDTSSILSGIIIGMVPYIDNQDNISITITPIVSDLVRLESSQVGTTGQNQVTLSLPTIDLREMSTTVRVKDGEMVVIGGLISKKKLNSDNDVPLISKLPLLGWLFKSHEESDDRLELIIMLRPRLIRS